MLEREKLVEHRAKGKQIRTSIDHLSASIAQCCPKLLRRHVRQRSSKSRVHNGGVDGQIKIEKHWTPRDIQQNVGRLDVAVQNVTSMHITQRVCQLNRKIKYTIGIRLFFG